MRQKINQAYADVDFALRGVVETGEEDDWTTVEKSANRGEDAICLVLLIS